MRPFDRLSDGWPACQRRLRPIAQDTPPSTAADAALSAAWMASRRSCADTSNDCCSLLSVGGSHVRSDSVC